MQKCFKKIKKVSGELMFTGDKSISHRAVIFSAMALGESSIDNISLGEDVKSTIKIMQQIGAKITTTSNNLIISGCGFRGFREPKDFLDCGNSGTSARLITGLLVGQNFNSILVGDESLSKRPMIRVIEPLQKMGAEFETIKDQTLPLKIKSNKSFRNISYEMPVASAQVKSAILIAGLYLDDATSVIENTKTRNHTEKMLRLPIKINESEIILSSSKKHYPIAKEYFIPGDISSAAFHVVLTLLTPNSELRIKNVSLNPTRIGFINVLKKMGANILFEEIKISSNEEYGNVIVKSSSLKNINIDTEIIPNIIDEIPILTIAGIFAEGNFEISNASELRVKESDRINSICFNLKKLGLFVEQTEEGFCISGEIKKSKPVFESFGDHRIAMAFAVLSMLLKNGGDVNEFECVSISNPMFEEQIKLIINY